MTTRHTKHAELSSRARGRFTEHFDFRGNYILYRRSTVYCYKRKSDRAHTTEQ